MELPTLFSISSANDSGCSLHFMREVEIQLLNVDEKCIDVKEKESLYVVEA